MDDNILKSGLKKTAVTAVALASLVGCASTGTSVREMADLGDVLRARYECVAEGNAPKIQDISLRRRVSQARGRANYVLDCLGKNSAYIGYATENPVELKFDPQSNIPFSRVFVYNPNDKK